jgi:hypothetical protein
MSTSNFVLTDVRHTKPILSDLRKGSKADQEKYSHLKDKLIDRFADTDSGVMVSSVVWLLSAILTSSYILKSAYFENMMTRLRILVDLFAEHHTNMIFSIIKPLGMFFPFETFRFVVLYYINMVYRTIFGLLNFAISTYTSMAYSHYFQLMFMAVIVCPLIIIDFILSFIYMFSHELFSILLRSNRKRSQFIYRPVLLYGIIVLVLVDARNHKEREAEVEDFVINCLKKIVN